MKRKWADLNSEKILKQDSQVREMIPWWYYQKKKKKRKKERKKKKEKEGEC